VSTEELSDGWTHVKFGEVVRNVNDISRDLTGDGLDRIVGLDHLDPGSLRLVRWDALDELPDGTTFTRRFKAGQVLFGKRRAYQRKVAVPDFEGVCSGDILVFEPSNERMLSEFLPYLVQSDGFFEHALGTSAGSLSPRTKWADLARYEFALPAIDEQQRIVEVLSAVVNCQDSLLQQVAAARNLRDSVLEEFLESANQSWPSISIRELAVVCTGGIWGSDPGTDEVDVLVYRQTEFNDDGRLSRGSCVSRSASKRQLESRRLQPGDILLQKSAGTPSLPGRVVIVPNSIEPDSTCSNFLQLLRANPEKCEPQFLFWALWYRHRRGVALEFQRGTNIRNLDLNRYLGQTVHLPSRTEQQLLLNRVSLVEDLIDKAEQALADAVSLGVRLREVLLGVHSVH